MATYYKGLLEVVIWEGALILSFTVRY